LKTVEHGFGGPPKPTGQRPVLPLAFGCATDDRRYRRCNGRSADCQSATRQTASLRYRWPPQRGGGL